MDKLLLYLFCVVLSFSLGSTAKAQDQQFTQFYANPLQLSPAFAGTSIQSRFGMTYRNQWPAVPKAFISYQASFDQYFSEINSGIGVQVSHEKAGSGGLSYTSASVQYAYEIKVSRKMSIRPALSLGFGSSFLDVDKLTFMDQLARQDDGLSTLDPDRARFVQKPLNYPDFGAGLLFFADKVWLGGSIDHMNRPVHSLSEGDARLPAKLGIHGGVRIKLTDVSAFSKRQFLIPAFNYQSQGLFDQVDIGFYYEYDPLILGVWYRGLPGLKNNGYGYLNQDAIAILVGYEVNKMKIGYSYDLTVSQLTPNSGGSHEITLVMEWASKKSKRQSKRRVIPCAKF